MLKKIAQSCRGIAVFILYALNVIIMSLPIIFIAIVKMLLPFRFMRYALNYTGQGIAYYWIGVNNFLMDKFNPVRLEITGAVIQDKKAWFLLIANHQSWLDILLLQRIFNGKLPFLKFFIKKQLIWLPFAGLVWWALGFPFLSRHSQAEIAKNPQLKDIDFNKTITACQKFKEHYSTVTNFVEGTRMKSSKKAIQNSPYVHLLKPKAGGVAVVLNTLKDQIKQIVNVTIAYPDGIVGFWDFICGRVSTVKIHVHMLPVTPDLIGDYTQDPIFQQKFQQWLNELWAQKDKEIEAMLSQ